MPNISLYIIYFFSFWNKIVMTTHCCFFLARVFFFYVFSSVFKRTRELTRFISFCSVLPELEAICITLVSPLLFGLVIRWFLFIGCPKRRPPDLPLPQPGKKNEHIRGMYFLFSLWGGVICINIIITFDFRGRGEAETLYRFFFR